MLRHLEERADVWASAAVTSASTLLGLTHVSFVYARGKIMHLLAFVLSWNSTWNILLEQILK